ncbi:DUF4251 domain-containing protein [Pedobacter alpinus]|uniref:DUF4251 domain-containing protein n=1 Tax=Pedobacter alpinus TaxID=1590643 RepID=A0ABW5TUX2_9SPHI
MMYKLLIKNKIVLGFSICILFVSCLSQKEKAAYKKSVEQAITENRFRFIPQQVNPLRAGLIISPQLLQLDGTYSLKVTPDSLISYLPYFGVAQQQVDYGGRDSGLSFTSTDFTYNKKDGKKGGYEITIQPKNSNNARTMYLSITESGTATLNINSNNRDAISFNGVIEAK